MVANRSKQRAGFTLVELLVVIGIIALLISILLPALNRARASASTISCLARMKQVGNAAVLYTLENKGYYPPMALVTTSAGSYGRPTVFPRGVGQDDAFLSKFLGKNATKLFVCPTLEGSTAAYQELGGYSYRYSRAIGGDDATRYIRFPYGSPVTGYYCSPWKASQIRQSSNMALFTEHDLQEATNSPGRTNFTFTNYNFGQPVGQNRHASNLISIWHSVKYTGGTVVINGSTYQKQVGFSNVAFCDGSARSIPLKIDQNSPPVWDDVYFSPYYPTPKY